MKILYIKNNSERNAAFQLRTTIYEDNGCKFVKKEAITHEAIQHIANMKASYKKLSEHIVNSKFKLAKILNSDEKSITFEFIEGASLEKEFHHVENSPQKLLEIFNQYQTLLTNTFKTTYFDHTTMVNAQMKICFGDFDYSIFDGDLCYKGICNIDMILSNIILKDDTYYLIDYEWAYEINLPVNYILYRTFNLFPETYKKKLDYTFDHTLLFHKMERNFIDRYVMRDGFYFHKNHYIKVNTPITEHLENKENHIQQLEQHVKDLEKEIKACQKAYKQLHTLGEELTFARAVVEIRDQQIEALRIKNRIKNTIKKIIPGLTPNSVPETPQDAFPVLKKSTAYHCKKSVLTEEIQNQINQFSKKPLLSIIMPVYNVDPKWLDLAIKSIESQWYENWELCIADDCSSNHETLAYLKQISHPRIHITFLNKNLNISGASNKAIEMSRGEYIVLMDNDDEITPDAFFEVVKAINGQNADFIYSDEDFIDTEGICQSPHFKPDFSPDLLLSHNYITHLTCFKKSLLDTTGGFNSEFDGAQDFDLFLRLTEVTQNIYHIPKVLYHWRMLESSTSANSEAKPEALKRGKRLLEATLERRGVEATVEYANMANYFRVKYVIKDNPLVSIIIPFKDKPELLDMCINSVLEKSTYQNYEIIGISNNSEEDATFEMMRMLEAKDNRVKFYEYNIPFNYAQINNHAVDSYAKGKHVLLLNNDIEVITPEWIEAMLEHSQRKEIGCVGAKLYYPDDTIQHAGIIIGLGGYAGHSHKMYPRDNPGYFNRLNAIQNVSAVTAACLMIEKRIYQQVNGMDEVKFKVAYNDVDFCLRVLEEGYYNLFTPYAEMYHHESVSRGYETTPEKIARFQTEKDALMERHKKILTHGDPYYNPNLTHDKEDFSLCPKQY